MADVTIIRAGRWGLSRPLFFDGGWTTYAMQQRLGSLGVENYWPPKQADGSPHVNAVLVRLKGTVTAPSDGNTVLFPRNLADLGDVTLGELTAAQRTAIRNTLETWLTGYTFVDWDGTLITIPPFSDRVATYTADTTLKQVARHIYRHFAHSTDRPKPRTVETHNTEYLDDFSTDPFATGTERWTNERGTATWDSTNDELDCDDGSQDWGVRYSVNGPGSIEHEAQATHLANGGGLSAGGGAVRFHNTGTDDWYYHRYEDWSGQNEVKLARLNAGSRTDLATYTFVLGNDWVTFRMAASGTAGNSVVVDSWFANHGASKPSDPGWVGVDDTPDETYTDSDADRLDDAAHAHCGIAGRTQGTAQDTQHCFFKLRAISDRGGAASARARLVGGKLVGSGLLVGGGLVN